MDVDKVQAVRAWPQPQSVRALRGFLGLAGYYRRFIKDYGILAAPLTHLLKKEQFHWSEAAEHSFTALKEALSSAPVLHLPNFSKPFLVEQDLVLCCTKVKDPLHFSANHLQLTPETCSL